MISDSAILQVILNNISNNISSSSSGSGIGVLAVVAATLIVNHCFL